jgi:hypothetical protein
MSMPWTEFNKVTHRITRRGICQSKGSVKVRPGCAIVYKSINPLVEHIEGSDFIGDEVVNFRVVEGPVRRRQNRVKSVSRRAMITEKQWQDLLARVDALENP